MNNKLSTVGVLRYNSDRNVRGPFLGLKFVIRGLFFGLGNFKVTFLFYTEKERTFRASRI